MIVIHRGGFGISWVRPYSFCDKKVKYQVLVNPRFSSWSKKMQKFFKKEAREIGGRLGQDKKRSNYCVFSVTTKREGNLPGGSHCVNTESQMQRGELAFYETCSEIQSKETKIAGIVLRGGKKIPPPHPPHTHSQPGGGSESGCLTPT